MSATESWLNAVDEERVLSQASALNDNNDQLKKSANPDLAKRIGEIYRANPWMKAGEILALAKAGASNQLVEATSDLSARQSPQRLDAAPKKSWIRRNVYDRFKETVRWGFSALNFGPEAATNVASQLFSSNDPAGWDGWFKSTSLGTMIADSEFAGEGYFLGGEAAEKQSERAARFRGTINGKAWTVGRGSADLVFTPGSKEYNFLSGVVDAGVAIFADPTIVGSKVAGLVKGARLIPALMKADEISAAAKIGAREMAGLTQAEEIAWDASKFRQFMVSDGRAQAVVARLVENDDAFDILSRIFDYRIDPEVALQLADANTPEQVIALIGGQADRMGLAGKSLLPEYITDIPGAQRRSWVKERLPGYNSWRKSRLLTEVPDTMLVNGSSLDRVMAIKNTANWLKSGGVDITTGRGKELMDRTMVAYSTGLESEIKAIDEVFEDVVSEILTKPVRNEAGEVVGYDGVNPDFVREMFRKARESMEEQRLYYIDEAGTATDGGFVQAMIDTGQIDGFDDVAPNAVNTVRLQGPGSVLELLNSTRVLPDIRTLRRLTANPILKKAVSTKGGDPSVVNIVSDYLQNEIWKPLTLATGGYIFRNMFDAQLSIAAIGKSGLFRHPFDYIMYVLHRRAPATITGRGFDDLVRDFEDDSNFYAKAMNYAIRRNLEDPVKHSAKAVKNGSWSIYDRTNNRESWVRALLEEYREIGLDGIMNAIAKGIGADEIIEYLRATPKGKEQLESLTRYLQTGIYTVDASGYGRVGRIAEVTDDVLREWIQRLSLSRINLKTGGDDELRFVLGYRRVPKGQRFGAKADDFSDADFIDGPRTRGRGSLVRIGVDDEGTDLFGIVVDTSGDNWTIQPVSGFDIFDDVEGGLEFSRYVNTRLENPTFTARLPQKVKGPQYATEGKKTGSQKFQEAKDRLVDKFFVNVYGRAQQFLERSPLFRQFYYEGVAKYADMLTPDEAAKLRNLLKTDAQAAGMSEASFVGGKKYLKELDRRLAAASGEGTIAQLDEYAQMRALEYMKRALYDAQSRNNLEDTLRILVPFGVAWREILTRWSRHIVENPTLIRRAQLVYNGAVNFDPDNDGQGFFYKDPTTGENTFNIPFSGDLAKLTTGLNAPLAAPVKRLSLGLQVLPAIGPVAQLGVSQFLPDTPSTDFIAEVLLPYGRKESVGFVPGWLTKLRSAIMDNPGKLQSIYANTYMETVRALSASGEYDLSDDAEKQRLFNDAKFKARVLTSFRAASQFLGPTAATPEFIVPTKEGDVMASQLVKAFYGFQQENYDTAVQRFLETFGNDAFLYISSKTRSTQPGLLATEAFGDWERNNGELLNLYPEVAAYFAPGGNDFAFSVWERQIRTGKRERLSDAEIVSLAQYRVGSAIYRDLKTKISRYPNAEERDWLARQRLKIHEKLPGFPPKAVFEVNKLEVRIGQLAKAVANPDLKNNPVAQAAAEYLRARELALAEANKAGLKSLQGKQAQPLRDYLNSIGEALADRVPDFQRLWEQELSSEVD